MTNDAIFLMKLGEVAKVTSGYPLRNSAEALESGDVHLLQLKNLNADGSVNWDEAAKVTLPSKKDPTWLTDNDIVFVARGTKTLAYALKNIPPRAVCAPQFFVLTNTRPSVVLSEFLAWQINQKPAQDYFQRAAQGTNLPILRREAVESLPIVVPSIHTQHLLVSLWQTSQKERAALAQLIINRETQMEALAVSLHQSATGAIQ